MAVCIYNSSWKDDLYLLQQLKEHNSKGMHLQEILSYVKRDFSQYSWRLITLNRRRRFVIIYRHNKNATVDEVTEAIKKECEGPGQLLDYRLMYHKIRQVHGLNITRDQVYAAMTDVDPEGLENRKPILKKKKTKSTFSSVGPNWVLSMDGHDKLMGYQNSTFPFVVYGCMDKASLKLLFIWALTSNNNPVYPAHWYFEYLYESKTLRVHIRIDKGSETNIMAVMQALLSNKRPNILTSDEACSTVIYRPSNSNYV